MSLGWVCVNAYRTVMFSIDSATTLPSNVSGSVNAPGRVRIRSRYFLGDRGLSGGGRPIEVWMGDGGLYLPSRRFRGRINLCGSHIF